MMGRIGLRDRYVEMLAIVWEGFCVGSDGFK